MAAQNSSGKESARRQDPLLSPLPLGGLTLRNRLMITAHEPNYSENGLPGARYIAYHRARAAGGVALTMTAGSAVVSADSPPAFGNLCLYKDEAVAPLKKLATACHDEGAAVMIQLTHLGRRTNWNTGDWLPILGPSPRREPAHRAVPKAAEDWDLARVVADYAAAVGRVCAAGFDGVEIEAYGHLLDQFYSPAVNRRDDSYGGDLTARLKFPLELVAAARAALAPGVLLGMRMAVDENHPAGLKTEEGLKIFRRLNEVARFDFLNIIRGHIEHDAPLADVIPPLGRPSAPHLDFAGSIRAQLKIPVFHAGRIADIATARHAVAEGKVDMVGMTRAHIAEPDLVKKIQSGREDAVRPCVGATYCLDRIYEGREALCIHNPATGRELFMPHEIAKSAGEKLRVTIIGAGPAGLEAARVCAARGHKVTLFEAQQRPGGQVQLAARLKRRRDLIGVIDWRVERCAEMGVEFKFGDLAAAENIKATHPQIVLAATGGLPQIQLEDGGEAHCLSCWDILSNTARVQGEVWVWDEECSHAGLQTAEFLARQSGVKVTYATPERFLGAEVGGLNYVDYAAAFDELAVAIIPHQCLQKVEAKSGEKILTLRNAYSGKTSQRAAQAVAVSQGTTPLDDVYWQLRDDSLNRGAVDYAALLQGRRQPAVDKAAMRMKGSKAENSDSGFALYRLGDAVSSRNIHAAIYDALRLCKDF